MLWWYFYGYINPEVKPKDDFKEKHPNYRNFLVDLKPPLKAPPQKAPKLNSNNPLLSFNMSLQ